MPTTPPVLAARRSLAVYFAVLVVLSVLAHTLIITAGGDVGDHPLLVLGLMWTPAVASIATRLARREGFGDVSFRLGGWPGARILAFAWVYPVVIGLAVYGAAWALGLATPNLVSADHPEAAPAVVLGMRLAVQLTIGAAIGCVFAFGEELGWRGYMLTRFVEARVPFPVLTGGLI